ncbi:hypothetical protein SASPL_133952 [Salvia splendens]|uniref:AAA+ ATPase domain-containing protein n=1 Tax=Salvia splendens TaxID=180675 RepID=A0A8X8ZII0_SALSN|nr:hypothetical protein SASPL_133952 [Salvia splendens]
MIHDITDRFHLLILDEQDLLLQGRSRQSRSNPQPRQAAEALDRGIEEVPHGDEGILGAPRDVEDLDRAREDGVWELLRMEWESALSQVVPVLIVQVRPQGHGLVDDSADQPETLQQVDTGMATPMVEDNFEDDQLSSMTTEDITRASRLLDNEIRILKEELQRTNLELESFREKIKENQEKIKLNKQLPYLVGNIVEILEMNPEEEAEEDGANIDLDSQRMGKCVVLKTSTRQTIFLPVVGLVDPDTLKPGDLVGVNKDSYLILDTLPSEYDSRVKAMEVDEKPTEDYNDVGGLEKQAKLVEAIVLPMTHKERFQKLGVRPPKGVLLYGPPGTGKTLMARACAAQTNATFLKLAGPQLVQMFIGDGAKLVRDAFQLAKEKSPCIIFIDEIDAIGTKRFDSEVSGDREVQRTMLELLNQLDGFSSDDRIKIHSRKMNVHPDVNFEELARSTDDFNGAQLKAVCVEAGMLALRRDATEVNHEDFNEGIIQVQAKKKASLNYYA